MFFCDIFHAGDKSWIFGGGFALMSATLAERGCGYEQSDG